MSFTDVETLRRAAHLLGFDLSVADLEPIRPGIERALDALAKLEALPVADVEPASQFRVI